MKIKRKTITKNYDGERYVFKNGVAKVPGTYFRGKQMTITISEFREFAGKHNKGVV
jgi:hypothetical protein